MLGKTRIKLILLMTAINLVFSCLVTNCPRGGKRENPDIHFLRNNIINSGLKRCRSCNPDKEMCASVYCSWEASCKDESHCITQENCCSESKILRVKLTLSLFTYEVIEKNASRNKEFHADRFRGSCVTKVIQYEEQGKRKTDNIF